MAWEETTGIEAIDQQLLRSGVPPHILRALGIGSIDQREAALSRPTQAATNADLIAKAGGMSSSSQPQPVSFITGGGSQRDLPAPIERLKENPQGAFGSSPAVSFIRRGNAPGAGPQGNATSAGSTPPISFLNLPQPSNPADLSARGTQPLSPTNPIARSETTAQVVRSALQGNSGTGGAQPISFLRGENPGQGVSPTAVPEMTNSGRMLRAANQLNAEAGGTQPTSAIQGSVNAGQVTTETPLTQTAAQPRSIEDEYRGLLKDEPTRAQFPAEKMPLWKKLLGAAASVAAGAGGEGNVAGETARRFFGSPERKAEEKFEQAHQSWEGNVGRLMKAANLRHLDTEDRNLQSGIDARNRGKTERPENLDREAYDYYVGHGMTPADARKRVLQDAQSVKPEPQTHTSPFEAFAYGSPEEKKAAQDFLDMEKRLGSRYKNPSEFEEKYRLFKEDPETYRAMFGDKSGGGPDRANAARMLNYFDKRRREVNGDFTLDDNQKQEQLKEIENLEKPFMDAAQPGNRGGSEDRVAVRHPDGRVGTVPRSQIDKAKKKGYRPQQ